MDAKEFNRKYKVGSHFIHRPHREFLCDRAVRTVDVANEFKCGVIVEINLEPYFVRINTLTPAIPF
ncbi:hypothetical protein CBX60_22460 [Salmonella enterica subsp. enterica serovar Pensacola]|nr:hypothetical protein [Salmonella enterica]ECT8867314.1 hypothetical protein [Salmonella enterica subsp. enterica serovar Pensacola]